MKINIILTKALILSFLSLSLSVAYAEVPKEPSVSDDQAEGAIADNVTGSYLSSQFARASGDIESAISYLQRVYREDPDNADVAVQLEGMLLLQGKIDEAVQLAKHVHQLDAQDPLATLLLTLKEVQNNKLDDAARFLDSASDEGHVQLWIPLLSIWLDVRQPIAKPLTLEGMSADVGRAAPLMNYHLALVNAKAGFVEEAAKNFKNAIEDPQDPPIRLMKQLLRFYDQQGMPASLTPLVQEYRKVHPEIDTLNDVPKITSVQDGISEVLFTIGGIMFGSGVYNDAAIYLRLATYLKPGFSEATLALGDVYSELRQYTRANQVYVGITSESKLYTKAQLRLAVNYDRMGKLKEALALLDHLAKQMPKDFDALVAKGDLLRIHSRYNEATDVYTEALKRIPQLKSNHWPILFARGSCLERQGKWEAAKQDLRQALALKPDQPDILNYLAYGWLEHGENLSEAREMIAKAVKARPNDPQIVDSMGWSLYLAGDYAGSTEYLEKAVELLPGDPTVNDHLGDVYWRLGRKTEARFQWERSLTFSPEPKLAETLRKKIKEGLPPTTLADTVPTDRNGKTVNSATP